MITARILILGAIALFFSNCEGQRTKTPEERAEQLRELILKLDPEGKGRAKICEDLQSIGADK